jgi:hypothetical protein
MSDQSGEMIDGETVEIRYQGESWWYRGTVFKARKLWVELTEACDADTHPPDKGEVACENTIAEWRRPGETKTYRNSDG